MKERERVGEFIAKRVARQGDCLILTTKNMQTTGPIGEIVGSRNLRHIAWWYNTGKLPSGDVINKCGNYRCVQQGHSEETTIKRWENITHREIGNKAVRKSVSVHRDMFWHMDSLGMIDWTKSPERLKHNGVIIRKY